SCVAVVLVIFFFFQAEDGIRDWSVTGVQTCALPIFAGGHARDRRHRQLRRPRQNLSAGSRPAHSRNPRPAREAADGGPPCRRSGIGRGSCRGKEEEWGGGRGRKKKERNDRGEAGRAR